MEIKWWSNLHKKNVNKKTTRLLRQKNGNKTAECLMKRSYCIWNKFAVRRSGHYISFSRRRGRPTTACRCKPAFLGRMQEFFWHFCHGLACTNVELTRVLCLPVHVKHWCVRAAILVTLTVPLRKTYPMKRRNCHIMTLALEDCVTGRDW